MKVISNLEDQATLARSQNRLINHCLLSSQGLSIY